jgi:hypothetical protein
MSNNIAALDILRNDERMMIGMNQTTSRIELGEG